MMPYLKYQDNQLYIENILAMDIAKQFGTPCFVYSRAAIEGNWDAFQNAFRQGGLKNPHRICYAVKANSNLGILNILAKKQAGFDIVSQGELERVLTAGGDPKKIIFSGVGKTYQDITRALEVGIFCFNVESTTELERINNIAHARNQIAPVALRVNPNIDAKTHPYIATGLRENKFGIDISQILPLCRQIKNMPNLQLIGIGCHIGSQLTELSPFLETIDCLLNLANTLEKEHIQLKTIDVGGGLGIAYQNETPPSIEEYIAAICNRLADCPYEVIIEPGRALLGNAGVLLAQVDYLKQTAHKNFAIVNTGMNDLIRPALYNAWHDIIPATLHTDQPAQSYDIVGPVCESADFIGKNRQLALQVGDILTICNTGAYGFCMSSNYNSRPRAPEVLVDNKSLYLLRERESLSDLWALEKMI